ncbi:MAG: poly(3-hydroxybutyrate) depolymerase [Hyphomicrobiaceae bacterium]|nr:poly(3-hydroxybutyrate) depolymerase [Hyphomicrobiaceae bacterium]
MRRLSIPKSAGPLRSASKPAAGATRFAALLVAALACVFVTACRNETSTELPALGGAINETSVSGISSGAYMAGQFELAHGRIVVGAAIIAGGPYGCAESLFADMMPGPGSAFLNITKAINGCMLDAMRIWGVPNPQLLAERAARLAEHNDIDPVASIVSDRVYLFTGKADHTVVPAIVAAAGQFYRDLGVPENQLKLVANYDAGHAFVTESSGLSCDSTGKPYVVDCDYDQAGDLLSFIYGPLQPPSSAPAGEYLVFDQRPFTRDLAAHGMEDSGMVYVPNACRDPGQDSAKRCRVHIAFHGCAQNRSLVGDAFVRETGFSRWADTNRLIVLFPQAATAAFNPQGCWDWWGYTGRDYLTRRAPQIVAVRRMLDRLASVYRPS